MDEYKDIIITDSQIHVTLPRKPQSFGRAVKRSINAKKGSRAYTTDMKTERDSGYSVTFHNPELEQLITQAQAMGKKIRFLIPKEGIPVYLGKDTAEFMESKRGKKVFAKTRKM